MPSCAKTLVAAALLAPLLAGCVGGEERHAALDPEKVERGRDLFATCAACHDIRKRRNGVGPHLVGIVGRPAGQARGYAYSEAMAGQGDRDWTPDALRAFLLDPEAAVPGTNMAITGLPPADADAVVTYLLSRE
ncbi:cytochrome c [Azospirillum fermentarium]|uniref:c-type cytochrome n=1 Tax=Azospirillum fermentarium TaxID=1233114 RepID=UPI002226720C|nr:c-type cytochrome [Azospirillum fermentarium]MCW2247462.1 cytochrome c [Azospirillum fermentarium]